jgi:hypothetical protein
MTSFDIIYNPKQPLEILRTHMAARDDNLSHPWICKHECRPL